jgi:hypothetical protein
MTLMGKRLFAFTPRNSFSAEGIDGLTGDSWNGSPLVELLKSSLQIDKPG